MSVTRYLYWLLPFQGAALVEEGHDEENEPDHDKSGDSIDPAERLEIDEKHLEQRDPEQHDGEVADWWVLPAHSEHHQHRRVEHPGRRQHHLARDIRILRSS